MRDGSLSGGRVSKGGPVPKPNEDWAIVKAREWLQRLWPAQRVSGHEASLAALLREVAAEHYQEGRRDESEDRL